MPSILDFSALSDDQLVELVREALAECVLRGSAVEAAVRQAGLDEAQKARVAAAAARREAERLKAEEERRIATEAAEKVRREAAEKVAEAKRDAAARLRGIAQEARSLFGSDQAEFTVSCWEKSGDRRIYIGHGYKSNWVEYHHDGDSRVAPGTLKIVNGILGPLAAHRGISTSDARALIEGFVRGLVEAKFSGKLEVNGSNAPRDPGCKKHVYIIKHKFHNRYAKEGENRNEVYDECEAQKFASEAEAREALPKFIGSNPPFTLSDEADRLEIRSRIEWLPFAPSGAPKMETETAS